MNVLEDLDLDIETNDSQTLSQGHDLNSSEYASRGRGRWAHIQGVLRATWKKQDIDHLENKLARSKELLMTTIMVSLWYISRSCLEKH